MDVYTIDYRKRDQFGYAIGIRKKIPAALFKDNILVDLDGSGPLFRILSRYQPYTVESFVNIDFGKRHDLAAEFSRLKFIATVYPAGWRIKAVAAKNKRDFENIQRDILQLDKDLKVSIGSIDLNRIEFLDFEQFMLDIEFGKFRRPLWIKILRSIDGSRWVRFLTKRVIQRYFKERVFNRLIRGGLKIRS